MIEHAGDDCVGNFFDGLGLRIESGIGRHDGSAGEEEKFHVFYLNEVQRSFAREEDEFLFFFKHDIGGAEEDIFAIAVSDAAEGAHTARNYNHSVARIRATGEGRVHAFDAVAVNAIGDFEALGKFLGDDGVGVVADEKIYFMPARIEIFEKALGIDNSAGTGDCEDDLHGKVSVRPGLRLRIYCFRDGSAVFARIGGTKVDADGVVAEDSLATADVLIKWGNDLDLVTELFKFGAGGFGNA
jgi:hypothetical protein